MSARENLTKMYPCDFTKLLERSEKEEEKEKSATKIVMRPVAGQLGCSREHFFFSPGRTWLFPYPFHQSRGTRDGLIDNKNSRGKIK